MLNHRTRLTALALVVTAAAALPASAQAKTQTLRFFERTDKLTLTHADGTVVTHPPFADPQPGDRLDFFATEFTGNHAHHTKRATASAHGVCTFTTAPEPDCVTHVALGGAMLIFQGDPGTVVGGTGRFLHATGRVLSSKEAGGGSDVVAKIRF